MPLQEGNALHNSVQLRIPNGEAQGSIRDVSCSYAGIGNGMCKGNCNCAAPCAYIKNPRLLVGPGLADCRFYKEFSFWTRNQGVGGTLKRKGEELGVTQYMLKRNPF